VNVFLPTTFAGGAGEGGVGEGVELTLELADAATPLLELDVVHAVATTPKANSAATIIVRFRMIPSRVSSVLGVRPGSLPGSATGYASAMRALASTWPCEVI
jgi:hypothetical protein